MSRQKLAAAYVASQQLSSLSKMDFSSEKTAGITMDDAEAYFPFGIIQAPEDRILSRSGHALAGTALGSGAGILAANMLAGGRGRTLLSALGGLGGGLKGYSMSREADPMYMKALRELGVDAYEY